MRHAFAWIGGLALLGLGCGGGGGGNCTPATDLSGLWAGSASHDDIAPNSPGTVSAAITEDGCTLGGTWTFTFGDDQLDKTLQISGSPPETAAVALKLNECVSGVSGACETLNECTYEVTGTLVSQTEISGTFATNDRCSQSETGSFDITLRAKLTPTPPLPTVVIPTQTPGPAPTPTP